MIKVLFIIFIVLILLFLTLAWIDGNRFVTVSYKIETPKIKKKHRYVVLADLHNKSYGVRNEKLLRAIERQEPEGILIAGDLLTGKPGYSFQTALELLEELAEKYTIYYGMGNHETRLFLYPETYGDMGKKYEEGLKKYNISLLKNKRVAAEDNIIVTGLDLDRRFYRRFQKTKMESAYLRETLGEAEGESFHILLAHNPDYFEKYSEWGADLVLSGHVHGGMMRLPFLGGVVSPSFKIFPKFDGGLFSHGKSKMVLSRGLGMHTIPVRIWNPGELVVINLVPEGRKKEG